MPSLSQQDIELNERDAAPSYHELPEELVQPVEKQRHFGILQYAMKTRFRKIMLVGLINAILIGIFFFLVIFFFEINKNKSDVIVTSTTPMTTTTEHTGGWCRGSYQVYHGKCLAHSIATDHQQAERSSTSAGAMLITMHNEQEMKWARSFIQKKTNSTANTWIGMYCTGNNMTNCVWDDTETVTYNNFATGHPNITHGLCVSFNLTDSKWYSQHCTTVLPAAHEMPVLYGNPYGCESTLGNYCYIIVTTPMPFSRAKKTCERKCAQFVSIHSIEENQWIRTLFSLKNNQHYTLGGYANTKKDIIWVDGSPTDYNNIENFYGPGCLYMSYSLTSTTRGNWFTGDCGMNSTFVCKRHLSVTCASPSPATVPTTPKIQSSCNSAPLQESGVFYTPNYPNPYPANTNCTWTLVTYGPQRISFKIENTSIGDGMVSIYDGDSERADSLANLTGSQQIHFMYSNGNVVFIKFEVGSNQLHYTGFNGSFMTIF